MIIHLTFSNIPIHFNKLTEPACSIDSVNLLIFKGGLFIGGNWIGCILLRFTFLKDL